jgi:hypothetical protein
MCPRHQVDPLAATAGNDNANMSDEEDDALNADGHPDHLHVPQDLLSEDDFENLYADD